MKKLLALLVLSVFVFTGSVMAETFSWSNPTTYVDGSAIPTAKEATIKTHLFYGIASTGPFTEFAIVSGGLATYTGTPPPDRGVAAYYTLTSELDAAQSVFMTPAIAYTREFIACTPGSNLTIKK